MTVDVLRELRGKYLKRIENRWFAQLQGVRGAGAAGGEFDLYVAMATRYRWTPEQVNALDPHFIDELLAFQAAEARHEEEARKDAERKKGR